MPAPSEEELREFVEEILGDKLRIWQEFEDSLRRRRRDLGVALAIFAGGSAAALYFGADRPSAAATSLLLGVAIWCGYWIKHRLVSRPYEYDEDVLSPLVYFVYPRWKLTRGVEGTARIYGESPDVGWEMEVDVGQEPRELRVEAQALRGSFDGNESLEMRRGLQGNPLEVDRRNPARRLPDILELGSTLCDVLEQVAATLEREE